MEDEDEEEEEEEREEEGMSAYTVGSASSKLWTGCKGRSFLSAR